MKTVCIACLAAALASPAWAQTTIYKLVDENGHTTYSNKPMKGATVVDLEPLTTIPSTPAGVMVPQPRAAAAQPERAEAKPVAIVTPLASIDPQVQKRYVELGSSAPKAQDRGPAGLHRLVESEVERLTPIIRAAGVVAN